jgi:hypothetical protein
VAAKAKATMADSPVVLGNEEKAAVEASGLQNVSIALLLQPLDLLCFANQLTTTSFRSLTVIIPTFAATLLHFDLQQPTGSNPP